MKRKSLNRIMCAALAAAMTVGATVSSVSALTFSNASRVNLTATTSNISLNAVGASTVISNGNYYIKLYNDKSRGVNVQYKSTAIDRADIVVDPLNGESNEIFTVVNRGNGFISIHPTHAPNLCLNALLGSACKKGQSLTLHNYENNDTASLWQPLKNSDGSFTLKNVACGYVIDLTNGDYTTGNKFIMWEKNGYQRAQNFWFVKTGSSSSVSNNSSSGSAAVNTTQSKITQRLDAMANGSYGNGVYKVGTRYTGAYYNEQCKGFAKKVHQVLFGYNIGSTCSKPNNHKINISSSNTKLVGSLTNLSGKSNSSVSNMFASARPGDFIQVRRSHGGSHSMIFMSSNSNGVTVYECNVDGRNGIKKATYSWNDFRSKNTAVSVYTAKNYYLH